MAVATIAALHAINREVGDKVKVEAKKKRSKLPRGVRRLPDGRLMIARKAF